MIAAAVGFNGQGRDMQTAKENGSALQKAVVVLETLFQSQEPMGLAELSSRLDLPRQTVHRIVRQLEGIGLINRGFARDHFTVGGRMLDLGLNALRAASGLTPMRLVLKDLVDEIGETCNVGVLDRDEIVYVERVECDWALRLQFRPGSRVPIHATAIGKMLLAHLPSRTRRRILTAAPLERFTDNTITDTVALEWEIKTVRRQGYAINNAERLTGLIGLAVPVFDENGKVIAGLATHGPSARLSVDTALAHLPALQAAARRLTGCLSTDGADAAGLGAADPAPLELSMKEQGA